MNLPSVTRQTKTNPIRSHVHVEPEEQNKRTNETDKFVGTENILMVPRRGDLKGGEKGDGIKKYKVAVAK